MSAEQERPLAAGPALRRRALLRALASSPVIVTLSTTSAGAQQSFGTSLCEIPGPLGVIKNIRHTIISNPDVPAGIRQLYTDYCRSQVGG